MPTPPRIKQLAKNEAEHLLTIKSTTRPWHLVVISAIAITSPIFFGALTGQLSTGILASLGSMVILNIPPTGNIVQRQSQLLVMVIAMILSFTLGLVAHNMPDSRLLIFAVVTFGISTLGRYLHLKPPSGMFMVMASVIAIFMPIGWDSVLPKMAIVASGAAFSWFVALIYSLLVIRPPREKQPSTRGYDRGLFTESLIVALFVVMSLALSLWLDMPYPYWVPVSCYIIMQGMHLRTIWVKQLHRILGTAVGMFVAWFLLSLNLTPLGVALTIFMMFIWIESMVVRHYALAVVMITPLTIFIAEYGRGGHTLEMAGMVAYQGIIQARFLDTVLGCSVALIGGIIMHTTWVSKPLMTIEDMIMRSKLKL